MLYRLIARPEYRVAIPETIEADDVFCEPPAHVFIDEEGRTIAHISTYAVLAILREEQ